MKVTAGDGDTVRDLQPIVVTRALGTAPHADAIWSVTLTPLGSTGNYAASGYCRVVLRLGVRRMRRTRQSDGYRFRVPGRAAGRPTESIRSGAA